MINGRFPEFGLKIVTRLPTARSADSIRCVGVSRSFLGVIFSLWAPGTSLIGKQKLVISKQGTSYPCSQWNFDNEYCGTY